jgi:Fe2+ or Zn2+ uptake regulation protein
MVSYQDLFENFLKKHPKTWFNARTIYKELCKKSASITSIHQVYYLIKRLRKHNGLLVQEIFNVGAGRKERLVKWKKVKQ